MGVRIAFLEDLCVSCGCCGRLLAFIVGAEGGDDGGRGGEHSGRQHGILAMRPAFVLHSLLLSLSRRKSACAAKKHGVAQDQ